MNAFEQSWMRRVAARLKREDHPLAPRALGRLVLSALFVIWRQAIPSVEYERASRWIRPAVGLLVRLHRAWLVLRGVPISGSVLHIGYQVHVVYWQSKLLEQRGVRSRFLAVDQSYVWDKQDYHFIRSDIMRPAPIRLWREVWCLLNVLNQFEVLHVHNGRCISFNGWVLQLWRALGRPIVVHWRGCDIRNYDRNTHLHPENNICENCDYNKVCLSDEFIRWQNLCREVAHVHLVTTPDLKDFIPEAHHLPFVLPAADTVAIAAEEPFPGLPGTDRPLKIVHVTNHPGIEGTPEIEAAITRLTQQGYSIEFRWLRGVPFKEVAKAYADADVGIGKMKMGYYANSQIECWFAGVPCITYVRDEFLTDEIRNSGLVLSDLGRLEGTIRRLIENPAYLREKRRIARATITALHKDDDIAARLVAIYDEARARARRGMAACGTKVAPDAKTA